MAEGKTWYEEKYGETWYCKELVDSSEELVVMKVGMSTGKIRYDRFKPNPHHSNQNYSHEWNDSSSKYGEHLENTSNKIKNKLGRIK